MKYVFMRIFVVFSFFMLTLLNVDAQTVSTTKINFLNPGIALERKVGYKNSVEINMGVGYNYSYPTLTEYSTNGIQAMFAPFLDVQGRHYYNFSKRKSKGLNADFNSGNFVALRSLFYGPRIAGNVYTYENYTLAVGPTWGFQRSKGRFNFLYSMGPIYYFDLTGRGNVFPLNFEINLGYHLSKKL